MAVTRSILAVIIAAVTMFCLTPTVFGSTRLNSTQFKALDALFVVSLPADENNVPDVAAYERACHKFKASDKLLRTLRPGCNLTVRALRSVAALNRCTDASSCRKAARELRKSFQKLANRQALENRAINHALSPGPCRDVLRTSANDMKALDLFLATLRELVRALTTSSTPDLKTVQRLLSRAQDATNGFLPARASRARFRRACG